jgi:hypothetical protein
MAAGNTQHRSALQGAIATSHKKAKKFAQNAILWR